MDGSIHQSVLLEEVVTHLAPKDGGIYIDVTCGLGGHTEALLGASGPTGRVLGVDRDPVAIELATGRLRPFADRVTLVEGDFSDVETFARASDHHPADGLIADLGVSSMQLDDPERGFSFSRGGPLDMRMGPKVGATAGALLETFDVEQLTHILRDFGELQRSRHVAEAILSARDRGKIESTSDLAEVIERAGGGRKGSPVHPATRAFQAIRIAVNRELEELEGLLATLPSLIRPGGRVAIISFHSLEDRMVKHAFEEPKEEPLPRGLPITSPPKVGPWQVLTKKPITPSDRELQSNPRSRSAKLRIAQRRADDEVGT